jgi:hypothetical protein
MSNQKIILEITAKVEVTIVNKPNEVKENEFKTPERKKKSDTFIVPGAPKRRRVLYPFDISGSETE